MNSSVYICYGYMYRFSSIRSETVLTVLVFPILFYIKVDYLYKSNCNVWCGVVWCGVMVSVLASSVIDHRFEPDRVKPKTLKLVSVASPLSMQH